MVKYIFKRILLLIPILIGVSFLVFSILALIPVDVGAVHLGMTATPESIYEWNEAHGLHDPFLVRYFNYMLGLIQGDFGLSWATNTPVATEFFQRVPTTLTLAAGTIILVVMVGIPVGIISAVKQYSIFDAAAVVSAMIFNAMPSFWLGLILMLIFSLRLGLLPATGSDSVSSFILPWITSAAAMIASTIRMTRSAMLEVIRADYIQTAKAKGAKPMRIVVKHELRNAMLPMITVVGLLLGSALAGAVIVETVFALPGVGTYMLTGINNYDMPVVMICVLFIATVIGVINLVIDVLYMYVDPRLRGQFIKMVRR